MNVRPLSLFILAGLALTAATGVATAENPSDSSESEESTSDTDGTALVSQGAPGEAVPSIFAGVAAAALTVSVATLVLMRRPQGG